MKTFSYLYILLAFTFLSCKNQNIEPSVSSDESSTISPAGDKSCTEHYYYYQNRKKTLGAVSTSAIIIGFMPGVTATQKEQFLAEHATYIKGKESYETYEYTSPEIIDLQPNLSCKQVEELLNVLKQNNTVRYANPTFIVSNEFRGIGGHFIVTLREQGTKAQLEQLATQTNTKIVEELSPELRVYLMEADKASSGNALEMANHFHRQPFVQLGEPDFVLKPSPIGTW